MVPGHFDHPSVFYIEQDQEEHIFGHRDTYFYYIQVYSQNLIQLERWDRDPGQTWVTVVRPPQHVAVDLRGPSMLQCILSQPRMRLCPLPEGQASPCHVTIFPLLPPCPHFKSFDWFGFHWSHSTHNEGLISYKEMKFEGKSSSGPCEGIRI